VTRWRQLPDLPVRTDRASTRIARLLAPVLVAAALWLLGRSVLAAGVLVAAAVLAVVTFARPAWAERIAGAFAAFGRVLANGLSWVLLAVVEVLVVIPVSALARLARRDPLHAVGDGTTRWERHASRVRAERTFGSDPRPAVSRGRVGRVVAAVPRVVGVVVLVALVNYGLGWTWDEWFGSHEQPSATEGLSVDELARAEVFRDDPWAPAYWASFAALQPDPVPFLLTRVPDIEGPDITSTGGVRRSYEPAAADAREVWFFGGGAAWGEGQRDLQTIPSEVARLAEAAGSPVRIVNFGQPGYTTWQSALLFEQQLAVRPAPDLAVFYAGADDVAVQVERASDRPSHYNAAGLEVALTGRDSAADQARDLWEEYRDTSVLGRLARNVAGVLGAQPAAAADRGLVERIEDLRARSDAVVADLGRDHDVAVLQVWQAAQGVPGDEGAYRGATTPDGAVDLRAVLDDVADEAYADGVLTDEDGARGVAEGLWPLVARAL
jgi:hypothetical protein